MGGVSGGTRAHQGHATENRGASVGGSLVSGAGVAFGGLDGLAGHSWGGTEVARAENLVVIFGGISGGAGSHGGHITANHVTSVSGATIRGMGVAFGNLDGLAEHGGDGTAVAQAKNLFVPISGNKSGVDGLFDNAQGHVAPEIARASMVMHRDGVRRTVWRRTVAMTYTISLEGQQLAGEIN